MTYYIYIENNKINGSGQAKIIDENINSFVVNELEYNNFIENPEKYVWDEETETVIDNPNYEEVQAQKEAERISKLTLTKRIFALALQEMGITYSQLKTLISTNEQAQLEWDLCVELERSNPLLDIMAAQIGVTAEQLDYIFRKGNGEDVELPDSETEDSANESEEL